MKYNYYQNVNLFNLDKPNTIYLDPIFPILFPNNNKIIISIIVIKNKSITINKLFTKI